jgi:Uma2 family endonuclease
VAVPRAKLGYAEYCCYPDDGRRHEIIDGDHYVNPAPSTYHQTVSRRLQHQLYTQIELQGRGVVYNAPVDVQLTDHDIVQPDLVVVLAARTRMITPTKIKGVPDLVVEILSPSTASNDLALKRQLYERTGVAEYWIADPDNHTLTQLVLVDGRYADRPAGDEVRLSVLEGVSVRLAEVW